MIALQQLIEMAPFSEKVRIQLLEKLPTLTDGQKYELTNLCWESILQQMDNTMQVEEKKILYEAATADGVDMTEKIKTKEDEIFNAFGSKLQTHVDKADLTDALNELQEIKDTSKDTPQTN